MSGHQVAQLITICCNVGVIVFSTLTILTFRKASLSYHRMYLSYARMYRAQRNPEKAAEMDREAAKALRRAWPYKLQPEEENR